jgi:hypothetical protein
MCEKITIQLWTNDSTELLVMSDPENAISVARALSHRASYRLVRVMTESNLILAEFTGWIIWKPESAHVNDKAHETCDICLAMFPETLGAVDA